MVGIFIRNIERSMKYRVTEITESHKNRIVTFIKDHWPSGQPVTVSKGKVFELDQLPGFAAWMDQEIVGVITYNLAGLECEIVSLDSAIENRGIGTALIKKVIAFAESKSCNRIWLITTNDNIRVIRYYQRLGFDMVCLYQDEIEKERKIKSGIPLDGCEGIPIKHAIEFEFTI
jgi:ribosomal protein S18 acetylase RimI-like enzyme